MGENLFVCRVWNLYLTASWTMHGSSGAYVTSEFLWVEADKFWTY